MSEPVSPEEYAAAQAEEWGTFVANQPIDIGGVRAFNTGHPVPKSHIDRGIVAEEYVDRVAAEAPAKQPAPRAAVPSVPVENV